MNSKIKILILINIFCIAAISNAQDYLGSYEAVPPKDLQKNQELMKAWEISKLSIQIFPDRIIFQTGAFKPDDTPVVTYTVNGPFLLVKSSYLDDVYYTPIYVHDKNTIFANGFKLIRVRQSK